MWFPWSWACSFSMLSAFDSPFSLSAKHPTMFFLWGRLVKLFSRTKASKQDSHWCLHCGCLFEGWVQPHFCNTLQDVSCFSLVIFALGINHPSIIPSSFSGVQWHIREQNSISGHVGVLKLKENVILIKLTRFSWIWKHYFVFKIDTMNKLMTIFIPSLTWSPRMQCPDLCS